MKFYFIFFVFINYAASVELTDDSKQLVTNLNVFNQNLSQLRPDTNCTPPDKSLDIAAKNYCQSFKNVLKKSYTDYQLRNKNSSNIIFSNTTSISSPGKVVSTPVGYAPHMAKIILDHCPIGDPVGDDKIVLNYVSGGKGNCYLPKIASLGALSGRVISIRDAVETIFMKLYVEENVEISEDERKLLSEFRIDLANAASIGRKGSTPYLFDNLILKPSMINQLDDSGYCLSAYRESIRAPYAGFGEINIFEDPIFEFVSMGGLSLGREALKKGRIFFKLGSTVSDEVVEKMIKTQGKNSIKNFRRIVGYLDRGLVDGVGKAQKVGTWKMGPKGVMQVIDATNVERIKIAESILGRSLTGAEKKTLPEIHLMGEGSLNNYGQAEILAKARRAAQSGFKPEETRLLMDHGVMGVFKINSVKQVSQKLVIKSATNGAEDSVVKVATEALGALGPERQAVLQEARSAANLLRNDYLSDPLTRNMKVLKEVEGILSHGKNGVGNFGTVNEAAFKKISKEASGLTIDEYQAAYLALRKKGLPLPIRKSNKEVIFREK